MRLTSCAYRRFNPELRDIDVIAVNRAKDQFISVKTILAVTAVTQTHLCKAGGASADAARLMVAKDDQGVASAAGWLQPLHGGSIASCLSRRACPTG